MRIVLDHERPNFWLCTRYIAMSLALASELPVLQAVLTPDTRFVFRAQQKTSMSKLEQASVRACGIPDRRCEPEVDQSRY